MSLRILVFFCILSISSISASNQLIFTIFENDDFNDLGLLPNSTGVQRKLNKSQKVQIWQFCDSKSDTVKCGFWSDENGRKIDDSNGESVTVERDGDTARLRNFHFGEDGEYKKYPVTTNEEIAYAETYFLFVVPKPPTTTTEKITAHCS